MSKKIKFILWIVVAVVTVIAIAIFGTRFIQSKTVDTVHPIVTFDIENYGKVKAELYPEYAPTTVTNIEDLKRSGELLGKLTNIYSYLTSLALYIFYYLFSLKYQLFYFVRR